MAAHPVTSVLCETFQSVLRSGRDEFNAQFLRARRQHPTLDPDAFREFLISSADPVVRAVEAVAPERASEVAIAAYLVGLELVAQRLAGPGAKDPLIAEGWRRVLPRAPQGLAEAPRRLLAAVSNALHQLASFPEARATQWIDEMQRLAPSAADADTFLKLGQIVAWRAGLAHFRTSALAAAGSLPEPLALSAVGASDGNWVELRARFAADPWFVPGQNNGGARFVKRVGNFRGFGGLFSQPPEIACDGETFYARSGGDCWLLAVDMCGTTFHRATLEEFELARNAAGPQPDQSVRGSILEWNRLRVPLPLRGEVTSAAANPTTFAVTESLSHTIIFIALGSSS